MPTSFSKAAAFLVYDIKTVICYLSTQFVPAGCPVGAIYFRFIYHSNETPQALARLHASVCRFRQKILRFCGFESDQLDPSSVRNDLQSVRSGLSTLQSIRRKLQCGCSCLQGRLSIKRSHFSKFQYASGFVRCVLCFVQSTCSNVQPVPQCKRLNVGVTGSIFRKT